MFQNEDPKLLFGFNVPSTTQGHLWTNRKKRKSSCFFYAQSVLLDKGTIEKLLAFVTCGKYKFTVPVPRSNLAIAIKPC